MAGRPLCSTVPGLFCPSDRTCVGPTQPRQRSETRHGICWWMSARDACFSWFCYSSTVHSRKWFELIILNSSLAHIKSQSPTMLPVILLFLANALRVQFSLGMPMMLEDCCMTSIRKYTKRSRVLETMLFDNSNGNKPMWNPRPLLKWARFSFLATLLILLLAFALEKLGVMTANVSRY